MVVWTLAQIHSVGPGLDLLLLSWTLAHIRGVSPALDPFL